MNKDKLATIIIIIILFLLAKFNHWIGDNKMEKLKKEGIFTKGNTLFVSLTPKNGDSGIIYEFIIDKEKIRKGKDMDKTDRRLDSIFLNKRFPVIYLKDDPEVNKMLIFPSDFEDFGKPFPDSLNWVKKYLK
jgi:hypothetical protein